MLHDGGKKNVLFAQQDSFNRLKAPNLSGAETPTLRIVASWLLHIVTSPSEEDAQRRGRIAAATVGVLDHDKHDKLLGDSSKWGCGDTKKLLMKRIEKSRLNLEKEKKKILYEKHNKQTDKICPPKHEEIFGEFHLLAIESLPNSHANARCSARRPHIRGGGKERREERGRGDSASRLNFPAPEHLLVSANHKLYRLIKHRRPITRASSHPRGRRTTPHLPPPPPLTPPSSSSSHIFFSSQDIFPSELFLLARPDAAEVSGGKGQICHRDYTFPCLVCHRRRHADHPPTSPSTTLGVLKFLPSKPTWTRDYC